MKKLFIFLTFLIFGTGLYAQQTSLTEAVDFTVTDCHGQTFLKSLTVVKLFLLISFSLHVVNVR